MLTGIGIEEVRSCCTDNCPDHCSGDHNTRLIHTLLLERPNGN
jgi:hypothetical protein